MLKNRKKRVCDFFQLILSFSLQKEGGSGGALLGNPDFGCHRRPSEACTREREEPLVILYLGGVPQVGLLSVVFC